MPNDQPPPGYHDASAVGGPPPGYHDASTTATQATGEGQPHMPIAPLPASNEPTALSGAYGAAVRNVVDPAQGMFQALSGRAPGQENIQGMGGFAKDLEQRFIEAPYKAQAEKASHASGLQKAGYKMAEGLDYVLPGVGSAASRAGEVLGSGDPWGLADAANALLMARGAEKGGEATTGAVARQGGRALGTTMAAAAGHVPGAEAGLSTLMQAADYHLDRAAAINKGQVSIVNGMVRPALTQLRANLHSEASANFDAAIAQDATSNQLGSVQGTIDTMPAGAAARAATIKYGNLSDVTGTLNKPLNNLIKQAEIPGGAMDLKSAHELTSQVGSMASSLARSGDMQNAAVANTLYDELTKLTQKRAGDINMGSQWKQAIDVTRTWKKMEGGLMGRVMDKSSQINPQHVAALRDLSNPDHAAEFQQILTTMRQKGVPRDAIDNFSRAREMGSSTQELLKTTSNLFIGKLRAIMKYPSVAGPAAAGAAVAGRATGIPGMTFVLPLIVAGKVAGALDNLEVIKLLREVDKRVGDPNQGLPLESVPRSLPPTPPPAAGAPPAPTQGTPAPTEGIPSATSGAARPNAITGGNVPPVPPQTLPALYEQLANLMAEQTARKHMGNLADKLSEAGISNPRGVPTNERIASPPKEKAAIIKSAKDSMSSPRAQHNVKVDIPDLKSKVESGMTKERLEKILLNLFPKGSNK